MNTPEKRAYNAVSIAFSAVGYHETETAALSVANINGATLVIEHDAATLTLTLQLDNGDVWSLSKWDDMHDGYGVLTQACAFIRRHTEQAAAADDHCTCPICDGDGSYPSRSGGNTCEECDGTGRITHCVITTEEDPADYPGDDACGICNGTGAIHVDHGQHVPCPSCDGAGTHTDDPERRYGINSAAAIHNRNTIAAMSGRSPRDYYNDQHDN